MVETVREILSTPIEDVLASSLSLKLLDCYSILYLGGAQPRWCTNAQRQYYQQLTLNGIEMAEKLDKAKGRTCVPAWTGVRWVPGMQRHYNDKFITDAEAKALLDRGFLKDKDFKVLPGGPVELNEDEKKCVVEIKGLLDGGMSKTKIREKYADVTEIGGRKYNKTLFNALIKAAEDYEVPKPEQKNEGADPEGTQDPKPDEGGNSDPETGDEGSDDGTGDQE